MDWCEQAGCGIKGNAIQTNILPMHHFVLGASKMFQVVVKDGWVVTIFMGEQNADLSRL
jgi:hypothetical protein